MALPHHCNELFTVTRKFSSNFGTIIISFTGILKLHELRSLYKTPFGLFSCTCLTQLIWVI